MGKSRSSSSRPRPGGGRPPAGGGRQKPGQGDGPPVVGKRPSNPGFLLVVGVMWLAAAVIAEVGLHSSWKLIIVVVFAGIGLLYLRGAAGSYLRRGGGGPDT